MLIGHCWSLKLRSCKPSSCGGALYSQVMEKQIIQDCKVKTEVDMERQKTTWTEREIKGNRTILISDDSDEFMALVSSETWPYLLTLCSMKLPISYKKPSSHFKQR